MISSISTTGPALAGKLYQDGSVMSMKNSYSVMEKTLEATEQQSAENSNSIQYNIDINKDINIPEHATAGGMLDIYA